MKNKLKQNERKLDGASCKQHTIDTEYLYLNLQVKIKA